MKTNLQLGVPLMYPNHKNKNQFIRPNTTSTPLESKHDAQANYLHLMHKIHKMLKLIMHKTIIPTMHKIHKSLPILGLIKTQKTTSFCAQPRKVPNKFLNTDAVRGNYLERFARNLCDLSKIFYV